MNKLTFTTTLITFALVLSACSRGEATPAPGLEPTRTPSSNTPAPRSTRAPTRTPAPQPTARPLAKNAITLDSAADLKVQATRDEAAVTQIYSISGNQILGVGRRSFELIDAETLETKTKTPFSLKLLDQSPSFWYTGSPDATTGATMETDGTVTIYDLGSGQVGKTLKLPKPTELPKTDIALNDDGSELIYANGSVQRYSVETGKTIGKAQDLPEDTERILFSEDGAKIAAVRPNGEIVILDTRIRRPKAAVSLKPGFKAIDRMYFSPSGSWFGAGDGTAVLLVWNLDARQPSVAAQTILIEGPAFPVFDAQGNRVAILNNGTTTTYSLDSGTRQQEFKLTGDIAPSSAHFSPDGETLYVTSDSATESFTVSGANAGDRLQASARLAMTRLAFTQDGKRILTWGTLTQSPELGIVDADTGEVAARLKHDSPVRFVLQGQVGKFVAVVTRDNTTHVWSLDDESEVLTLTSPASAQRSGALCLTPKEDGVVMIVDDELTIEPIAKAIKKSSFKLPAEVNNFAGCSNGTGLFAAVTADEILVLDLTGEAQAKIALPQDENLQQAALYQLSPDGKTVAAVTRDALYIWDVASKNLSHKVTLEAPPLFGFDFSGDGQRIDLNYGDAVDLVDVASGKRVALDLPTKPNARWVNVLQTADGESVVTVAMVSDADSASQPVAERNYRTGELTVWSAKTGAAIHTIETDDPLYAAAINEAGTVIATGGRNNVLNVWGVR
jgi:WD40 repeat protein